MTTPSLTTLAFLLSALAGAEGSVRVASGQSTGPPSNATTPAPPAFRTVRAELLDRVRQGTVPSVAIGVVRRDSVIWEEVIGWADREAGISATPHTLYPIASVSKSLTGTAVVALAAQGKLRLDDSAAPLLATGWGPERRIPPVQLSHLLAHRSGVPHLWHYEYLDRPSTRIAQVRLVRDNAFVAAAPGSRLLYSNLGYGVLARAVERASGSSFQQAMEATLFGPLGMRRTTVDAWVGEAGTVRGYSKGGEVIPYAYRLSPDGGAGFFSTLHDLLLYVRFQLIGSPTLPREASIVSSLATTPSGDHYLRGWGVVPLDTVGPVLISDGAMAGGTAALVLVPGRRLGVVVLCNATGCPIAETAAGVLSALMSGFSERFTAGVRTIEGQLYARGQVPAGRFAGSAFTQDGARPMTADFTDPAAPVLQLDRSTFRLEHLRWERGILEATAMGAQNRFQFQLWLEGDTLAGLVREEVRDDRPGFARLLRIELKPMR